MEDVKPSVSWGMDGSSLQVHGETVDLARWKCFVRDQLRKMVDTAASLGCRDIDSVEVAKIADSASNSTAGYYFGEDDRNAFETSTFFVERLRSETNWFSRQSGEFRLNTVEAREWLGKCDRLLKHMMLVFHLLSGQPARATELLCLRYRNTVFHSRNIFVHDGALMTVTRYSKTQWSSGRSSYIPRFLPRIVAKVFVAYVTQILPVRQYLASLMGANDQQTPADWVDTHLFCDPKGKPWDDSVLSSAMESETKAFGLPSITVRPYRHMAIAIDRKYLRSSWEDVVHAETITNAHDAQANHSSRIANRVYGRQEGLFAGVTGNLMDLLAPISMAWWSWHLDSDTPSPAPPRFVKFSTMAEIDDPAGLRNPGMVVAGAGGAPMSSQDPTQSSISASQPQDLQQASLLAVQILQLLNPQMLNPQMRFSTLGVALNAHTAPTPGIPLAPPQADRPAPLPATGLHPPSPARPPPPSADRTPKELPGGHPRREKSSASKRQHGVTAESPSRSKRLRTHGERG
jgi:hypothetical protein